MTRLFTGFAYNPPARRVQMVLNDYLRVSMDYLPYAFYSTSKTSIFAVTNAAEAPVVTVRLNAYDGYKFYKKVTYNSQIKSRDLSTEIYLSPDFSLIFMCKSWKPNFKTYTGSST